MKDLKKDNLYKEPHEKNPSGDLGDLCTSDRHAELQARVAPRRGSPHLVVRIAKPWFVLLGDRQ